MSDIWRTTVTATTGPLTDEQRESLVNALPGYPALEDDATGRMRLEFDVEADSEGAAVSTATRLFTAPAVQAILGTGLTVAIVTGVNVTAAR